MAILLASSLRNRIHSRPPARWVGLAALVLLAAVFGAATGYFTRVDMPGLDGLEEYAPPEMTRVLAGDGSEIVSFASEKRILLDHDAIPEPFRLALIASEDSRFEKHGGIDLVGVLRAAWVTARGGHQGASTLTMQLAGNLFLDRSQRTVRRKLQEAVLALQIEREFSKQEIFRMYCNQVHFGHGLFGLEAAARYYFGKSAPALSVAESATLVGLLPRPASYSPLHNLPRATERRNLVLRRMVEEGFLDVAEAQRLSGEPIVLAPREGGSALAPYFTEQARRWLEETYGTSDLYRGGLVVGTTLDPRLQEIANQAVARGLRELDERRRARAGGDAAVDPAAQAALIAIDPRSGEILALVGGRDHSLSEFDRAMQARRQPGSLFKPFVFAAALAQGWTLADTLLDEPTVFLDPRRPVPYQPENFSRRYYGTITLRTALEKSINISTVKLLDRVGYDAVIETARRLGIRSPLRPYPSLALGAFELSLLEVTSAYGAFANQGLLREPHFIREVTDRHGSTLHRARPAAAQAVSPRVAYLMNSALCGVVRRGTAHTAGAVLEHDLAGKTGTTDDNTDAWFVGYTPDLVVGVWVGFDEPRSLGERETGGRAALPIWIDFMRQALDGVSDRPFPVPDGIATAAIDPDTGRRRVVGQGRQRVEAFLEGTEPSAPCSEALHRQLSLPYPFQRYDLDARGALAIPGNELERLLLQEPEVRLRRRRAMLVASGTEGIVRVPVTLLPDSEPSAGLPELARAGLEPGNWRGTDGRPARIVWMGGTSNAGAADRAGR